MRPKEEPPWNPGFHLGGILYALCALLTLLLVMTVDTAGAEEPTFSIEFKETVVTANITSVLTDYVTIHGYITVPDETTVDYNDMRTTSPEAWSSHASPGLPRYDGDPAIPFQIWVKVPSDALMGLHDINLTVMVQENGTYRNETSTCHVLVNQFYAVMVKTESGVYNIIYEVPRRGEIEGFINIRNMGNGQDTFIVRIKDEEGIVSDEDLSGEVTIDAFDLASVPFRIDIDFGERETGLYDFTINVTSKGAPENGASPLSTEEERIYVENVSFYQSDTFLIVLITSILLAIVIVLIVVYRFKLRESP